jgi:hypothetical protein
MTRQTINEKCAELAALLNCETVPTWTPFRAGIKLTFDREFETLAPHSDRTFPGVGMMHHRNENGRAHLIVFCLPVEDDEPAQP